MIEDTITQFRRLFPIWKKCFGIIILYDWYRKFYIIYVYIYIHTYISIWYVNNNYQIPHFCMRHVNNKLCFFLCSLKLCLVSRGRSIDPLCLLCILGYSGGKHLDSLTPKKGSTKAKNELRKRKKLIEARFDTVLQVWRFGHPYNKSRKINFIGDHTLLNKKCRKFYILGGKFFLFWWNRKNAAYRAEKPCFGRKMAEIHGFSALEATFLQFRQNKKNSPPNM